MARYIGPKDRLSRREGIDLFGKGTRLTRLNVPPGVHGPKGPGRRQSQYGRQLREKQKVKRMYGLMEKQFRRYMTQALNTKGNTADSLFSLLESRLDNVVFRLGFAPTRMMARQLVSHRHVYIDGKRINVPSYQISPGETITLSSKALEIPPFKAILKEKGKKAPLWLKKKAAAGKIVRLPLFDDVIEPIEAQDIVEFYSR